VRVLTRAVLLAASAWSALGASHADKPNLMLNGSFEEGLAGWETRSENATIEARYTSDRWNTYSLTFKTKGHTQVHFYISVSPDKHSGGTAWFDNIRCEGVEIENPSFERTLVDGTAPGWYCGPGQPTGIGHATLAHNERHGLTSIVLPWFDLVTIREWAQVVGEARRRGRKVLGIMDTPWGHPNAYPNFRETAIVSWKIPAKGERGWVRFDPPEEE